MPVDIDQRISDHSSRVWCEIGFASNTRELPIITIAKAAWSVCDMRTSFSEVVNLVSALMLLEPIQVMQTSRARNLMMAKWMIYWILNYRCRMPLIEIARGFDIDHSTVKYGSSKMEGIVNPMGRVKAA